ncbi:hypothetical protein [Bradyrhizobium cenepequi]|uniref:hypothetical protein n=1 Tax=Bradyrhizobium cenepequi TaxID=2821403 RepID=UPI001CE36E7F|nr:hypothetical protein [Bradyrhizobium cenepequi]MCA6108093.1 hypothetical protein [Bradyrhizobium cenepequi]
MADDFINALGGAASSAQSGGGTAAGTTADILRNQVLSRLVTVLEQAFPQASASISTTATGGSAPPLPPNPKAFLTITVSGQSFKIPLYGV